MRLNRYIKEEDSVKNALDIGEPEVNGKYSERVIADNIDKIKKAISNLSKPKNDADEAILSDLEDKLEKWENVDKETKPSGPAKPPEEKPEEPPEEKEEEPPEEKEEPPKEKEEDDEEEKKKKWNSLKRQWLKNI